MKEGIYIDIFPFDTVSDSALKKWVQYLVVHISTRLIKHKTGFITSYQEKTIKYYIGSVISKIFPINFLKSVRYNCITRYNEEDSVYVVNSDGAYGIQKETLQRKWIENIKDYPFEDRVYPGIADYDDYLSYFYGDYMTPPADNAKEHHYRLWVDFGEY